MQQHPRGGGLRTAAVVTLGALFFVLAVGSALLSSGVYRCIAAEGEYTGVRRTALSYLANQLRRADRAGDVSVGSFGDGDALFLEDGDGYYTCVFVYEGALRELYTDEASGLTAADGVALIELSSLSIAGDGARLTFTVCDTNGAESALAVAPRCGYEVRP